MSMSNMKKKFKLERKELELLKDFYKLYIKYKLDVIPDKYDKYIIEILEEYDFAIEHRIWRKYKK